MDRSCANCEWILVETDEDGTQQKQCTRRRGWLSKVVTEDEEQLIFTDKTPLMELCSEWQEAKGTSAGSKVSRGVWLEAFKRAREPKNTATKKKKRRKR